jgi:hypothetical protein
MHAFGAAGNQRVPRRKIITIGNQSIRASRWQPRKRFGLVNRQRQALRYFFRTVCIVCAPTSIEIQQPARNVSVKNLSGFLVFYFVHATQGAAIAQGLPFDGRHL